MVIRKQTFTLALVASGLALALACGGSSTAPSPNPGGGSPGPIGATVTIGSNGAVSPVTVTINPGESVTFVNNHNGQHQISSDPHPNHTDCPAINALGTLDVNQSRSTNALTTSRTCRYHDHLAETNTSLQGSIVIR